MVKDGWCDMPGVDKYPKTDKEWEKVNDILFELLGEFCDKDPKKVMEDSARDFWMSSEEALDYGIIDEVIKTKR